MAQKFTVPVTIKNLSSAGSDGLTVFLDQESFARLKVEAGGRITWGAGSSAGDTNLYRDEANVLKTDDTFKSAGLFVAETQIDPSAATVGDALVFNGTKFVSASVAGGGGGGASLTVSDTAPASPSVGDLWFNSSNARTYVYYDSSWVEVGASGGVATLDDIGDVTTPSPTTNDVLQWNGTAWVNVAASTVGATTLDGLSDVVITSPEEFQTLEYNGTEWVNQYASVVTYVRNAEATTLTTGTAVYLFGATGDHATVKRADNDSDATSAKTVGLVGANIAASQNGPVITRGYVDGINLSVGYSAGDILWLGEDGAFTKVKPTAPEHLVFIGVVVRATNNGIIYVATQNGYELDELHDVKISSLSDGQFLRYNSASAVWVNDTINLGADTDGDYVQSLVAGTGVTLTNNSGETATPTIAIGQSVATSASVTFAQVDTTGDVTVGGNLTVNGTTTTLNTETLEIEDNIVVLNSNVTGSPTTNAGIEVERGTSANVALRWNETSDKWELTEDGATYNEIATADEVSAITISTLDDIGDVSASTAAAGDFLKYDGAQWVNDPINLGTDTVGNYVADVVSGTGISISHTPGEGSSASVALNAALDDLSDVTVPSPNTNDVLTYNGSVWTSASASGGSTVTASTTPPSSPESGSIWFDSSTAKTYVYYDSFWVEIGGTSGGAKMYVSLTAPSSPLEGQLWFKSDTAQTFAYYDSSWIEVGAAGMSAIAADTAPASPVTGQLWFNSSTGGTYVYYDSSWIEIGAHTSNTILNLVNAKGDLLVATADNVLARQAVGTDGQLLQANSATTNGLEWFTPNYATLASPTFTGNVTGNPAVATTSTGTSGFGYMGLPQNSSTTGAYGVVAADAGTHIYSSATRTVTIPENATIAMPVGSTIVFIAGTGATVTIAITTDTMYLAGAGTTGSRTLAPFGMATAVKITSTSWIISGNGLT